jgi:hypothetical protein
MTNETEESETNYKYGDDVIAEGGKKSRGGLRDISELYAPGVELVSGNLLAPTFKSKITLAIDSFTFNTSCVKLFNGTQYIEFIIDKPGQRLIVLPSTPIPKESVKFALVKDNNNRPRKTVAKDFCALLFHYMQWSIDCRYRIMAIYQELNGQQLLVFNLDEAVEVQMTTIVTNDGKKKTIYDCLLPFRHAGGEHFGHDFSEVDNRKKVDLNDIFLFINPKTGETKSRTIEPRIPDADGIIKSNYRPNPDKEKIRDSGNSGGDGSE